MKFGEAINNINRKLKSDTTETFFGLKKTFDYEYFYKKFKDVEKIIFNIPATIVILKNGRKGIVKIREGEIIDPEKGFLYAYIKAKESYIEIEKIRVLVSTRM